ncbi:MAG: tetratricopeptide repeat protein, partial [Bacteroidales bacterium]
MRILRVIFIVIITMIISAPVQAQINAKQVTSIGRNALYFEDYILSIQYFNQAIKAKPYLADPYLYRGIAKLYLEDYRGAEEDCSLAMERNPFITDIYQIRGVARQSLHKYEEAIEDYTKGLQMNPENKNMIFNKALAEMALKDYDAAKVSYDTLIDKFPKYDVGYLGQAQMLIEIGDTIAGVASITKAIEVNKNNSQAYLMRAGIAMKGGSDGFATAIDDMDAAIKLEPNNVDYFINRAYLRYKSDDYFGAMSDFDYAVSLDPNNRMARYNRALLLIEVKENNRAIVDLTEVLAAEPDNIFARYNRANLYTKTGQYDLAVEDYDVVLEAYPDLGSIIYERSECKKLMGDISGAERDYYAARKILDNKQDYAKYLKSTVAEADVESNTDGEVTEEQVIDRFKQLMTVNTEREVEPKYDNKTRGRIQDDNDMVVTEDIFTLSYYDQASAVKVNNNYTKETDEINQSKLLSSMIFITNKPLPLTESQIANRFKSIEYFSASIYNGSPRIADYIGRALDYLLLKDYDSVI